MKKTLKKKPGSTNMKTKGATGAMNVKGSGVAKKKVKHKSF